MRKITGIERDWMASFIIAVIASMMIYLGNRNGVRSYLDLYILEAGVIGPFLFPLYIFIHHHMWRRADRI